MSKRSTTGAANRHGGVIGKRRSRPESEYRDTGHDEFAH